jgi:peptidoglycan/LPS O-acetylase OafA/YrhL
LNVNLNKIKYRPDIDGLRAIAVLAVVLHHAFPIYFTGGFVGVDVFFVISGYLISMIVFKHFDEETFSFSEFYIRRIRRIFPSLITVLITCYIFGWFTLLSDEYKELGKQIVGTTTFVSNFVFWKEAGYFDDISAVKPLLHTWSLGIEEQFYIIWPLLAWLTWKLKLKFLITLLLFGLLSFLLNILYINSDAVGAFYAPWTRFWEIALGGVLAYMHSYTHTTSVKTYNNFFLWLKNISSVLGLLIIIYGTLFFTNKTVFPGWNALIPTFGAALIIAGGPFSCVNKFILSNRLIVWIGLISFPLYLWHWPLLSFLQIIEGQPSPWYFNLIVVVISIILSTLTYHLIEKPLRFGQNCKLKSASLICCITIIGLVGYITFLMDGLIFRTANKPQIVNFGEIGIEEQNNAEASIFTYSCNFSKCRQSKYKQDIEVAILGDSHADRMFLGLSKVMSQKNIAKFSTTALPYPDNEAFKDSYNFIASEKSIKIVIIAANWQGRDHMVPVDSTFENEIENNILFFLKAGKQIYIADDNPAFAFDPKICKFSFKAFLRRERPPLCEENINTSTNSRNLIVFNQIDNVVKKYPSVIKLKIFENFCNDTQCSMRNGNQLLYSDSGHLNVIGSTYLANKLILNYPDLLK